LKFLFYISFLTPLSRVEGRQDKSQSEEEPPEPPSDRGQHIGRLRAEKRVCGSRTESSSKPLILRTLHKHSKNDQQTHQKVRDQQKIDEDIEHG
jgi:hypothetical protein